MLKRLSPPIVVVLAAGMLTTACDSSRQEPTRNPPGDPPKSSAAKQQGAKVQGAKLQGATGAVAVGAPAPDVSLKLHDGSDVKLSSLKGKHVVLYFYPKDDTPGCRIEAQGFRDNHEALNKADIKVFGVSLDDAASHQAFIDKEKLNFALVVDDGSLAKAFGVPVTMGFASRQTILIGPDGKLKKIWRKVSPSGHAEEVLAAVNG